MASYSVTVSEGFAFTGLTSDLGTLSDTFSFGSGAFTVMYRGATISDGVGVSSTLSTRYAPVPVLTDGFRFSDPITPLAIYGVTLSDLVSALTSTNVAYPVSASEAVGLAPALTAKMALTVAERLGLTQALDPLFIYTHTVNDKLRFADSLGRFMAMLASDGLTVGETLTPLGRRVNVVSETIGIGEQLIAPRLVLVLTGETIDLADTDILHMVYRGVLGDGLRLTAGYVSPDGNFTAWAVNTRTGAVTEYQNYAFNSFAQVGHKYLGATSAGLYELNGDDDDGDNIVARIASGYAQMAGAHLGSFKAAYLGVRGAGDFVFKLETADGRSYTYDVVAQEMQTTKVRLGKGLRARYFAFELQSTGQDFDLENIEFIPIVAQRRV